MSHVSDARLVQKVSDEFAGWRIWGNPSMYRLAGVSGVCRCIMQCSLAAVLPPPPFFFPFPGMKLAPHASCMVYARYRAIITFWRHTSFELKCKRVGSSSWRNGKLARERSEVQIGHGKHECRDRVSHVHIDFRFFNTEICRPSAHSTACARKYFA